MTQQSIEKLETQRRASEAQNKELLNYVGDNTRLSHAAKNEIRVSQARRANTMARVAAENMVAQKLSEQEYNGRMNKVIFEQVRGREGGVVTAGCTGSGEGAFKANQQ